MKVAFKDIWNSFIRMMSENALLALAFIVVIAAIYSGIDLVTNGSGSMFVQLFVSIFGQYYLTAKLLSDRMPDRPVKPAYGSIFGAAFLSGLGILLGLVFLIVPGIYLMGRWSMATPLVVVEEKRAIEALGESWERSEASAAPLFVTYLVGTILFAALLVGFGLALGASSAFADSIDQGASAIEIVSTNVLATVLSVLGWVLACAIYRSLTPADHSLKDVFA